MEEDRFTDVLEVAITKKGWKPEIRKNTGSDWAAIVTVPHEVIRAESKYIHISSFKAEALLGAYLKAFEEYGVSRANPSRD